MYAIMYIGGDNMTTTNITNFRKKCVQLCGADHQVQRAAEHQHEGRRCRSAERGRLQRLMETLYLVSVPGMREKIMDGLKQPLNECLDEDAVEW